MRIFLIAGKAESGKGEVAKYIKEFYIYKKEESAITEYGKSLKKFAMELKGWDGNAVTKPRKFLQEIGAEIRTFKPNYLINNMIEDIEIYEKYVQNLIIADVRLPIEIEEMKNMYDNVYSIHIDNQHEISNLSIEEQIDYTEIALEGYSDFDYTIANDNKDTLKDKVFKILEGIN